MLRNGFRVFGSIGLTVLLGGFVLSGCASDSGAAVAEGSSSEDAASPTAGYMPDAAISELASTSGNGTAVSFPDNTQPSFAAPGGDADRMKVYGSPWYRYSGDNTPVPINVATLSEEHEGGAEHGEAAKSLEAPKSE